MSTTNIPDDARDVKGFYDGPIPRLVAALRTEGYDDVRAGCVVLRAYPWSDVSHVVDLMMADYEPAPLPDGWRRGMFAGRAAELAVRARRAK
jgi:hypothetical protein